MAFVVQAVVLLVVPAGGVPSTGEVGLDPVQLLSAMLRPAGTDAENVAVTVVVIGRPDGACAYTMATFAPLAALN
jgi:hypothetical protein